MRARAQATVWVWKKQLQLQAQSRTEIQGLHSRDGDGVMNRPPSPLTMFLSRHTRRREASRSSAAAVCRCQGVVLRWRGKAAVLGGRQSAASVSAIVCSGFGPLRCNRPQKGVTVYRRIILAALSRCGARSFQAFDL